MIDLTTFGNPYQIKMADGTVLTLKRPTQALQQSILNLQKYDVGKEGNEKSAIKAMGSAIDIFVRILNRNQEGIVFTREQVEEEYDYTVALMVISDYLKFYAKEVAEIIPFQRARQDK